MAENSRALKTQLCHGQERHRGTYEMADGEQYRMDIHRIAIVRACVYEYLEKAEAVLTYASTLIERISSEKE